MQQKKKNNKYYQSLADVIWAWPVDLWPELFAVSREVPPNLLRVSICIQIDRKPLYLSSGNFGFTLELLLLLFFLFFLFFPTLIRSFFVVSCTIRPQISALDRMNQTSTNASDLNSNRGEPHRRREMMTINDNRNWKMKCNLDVQ